MPDLPPEVPPLPDRYAGRTAFLRSLIATAVVPVIFVLSALVPVYYQAPFREVGFLLWPLAPVGLFAVSALAFVLGRRQAALGYLLGAGVSVVVEAVAWVVAVIGGL